MLTLLAWRRMAGKLAGLDKKMSRSLDAELEAGSSPLELSQSPLGPLAESSSRKTLIYLVSGCSPPLYLREGRKGRAPSCTGADQYKLLLLHALAVQILTLNHIYPDYDFSLLRAHHFIKV